VLLERIYGWFYVIINVGSASAKALIPKLLDWRGPAIAFGIPGVLFLASILVFWAGRRRYVRVAPTGRNPHGFLKVVRRAVKRLGTGKPGEHWLDGARDRHPAEAVEGARAVFRILGVFAAVTIFWTLFDQKASSWVAQSKEMGLALGGVRIGPAQMQVLNPILILVLIPLFNWAVFPVLERRGVALTPLRKMTAGMFFTVLSFAAAAVVQSLLDAGTAVHVLWQVPQYVLLTVGEILVSVTGLEFSFTQAPRSMRSAIMSFWYLTIALGNLLTALVTELVPLTGATYFWFFAALMLIAAVVFRVVARRYRAPADAPVVAA
jgi:proton-dependent oligopeptide transporter, POT family